MEGVATLFRTDEVSDAHGVGDCNVDEETFHVVVPFEEGSVIYLKKIAQNRLGM